MSTEQAPNSETNNEKAYFAAGCFWGVEETFRQLTGVKQTSVGYSGGHFTAPTYELVCMGNTGHAETVEVVYDPTHITYSSLLDVFWQAHDPTTLNRQGPDMGTQYRSAIFFVDSTQQETAIASKEKQQNQGLKKTSNETIVTEITPLTTYHMAEDYHQQYVAKRQRG